MTQPSQAGAQPVVIYGLYAPHAKDCIMYVGKANDATARLREHIREARRPAAHQTQKVRWIRALLAEGVQPGVCVLETTTLADWQARECFWISHHRNINPRLLNVADGGNGPTISTAQTREHIRTAMNNPEVRQRHLAAIAGRGQPHAAATRAALAPADVREKLATKRREAWQDPTYRARHAAGMARARKGISATMRQRWQEPDYRQKQLDAHVSVNPEAWLKKSCGQLALPEERIVALYQQGLSLSAIAREVGVGVRPGSNQPRIMRVRNVLKRAGVYRRKGTK